MARIGNVAKPRQRSEISLSLDSVLVISVKVRRFLREGPAQRLGGGLAGFSVAVLQQVEGRLDGERLGPDSEAQARDGVVEQPVPGTLSGHGFLMEELLDAILELIGLFLADVLDPRR